MVVDMDATEVPQDKPFRDELAELGLTPGAFARMLTTWEDRREVDNIRRIAQRAAEASSGRHEHFALALRTVRQYIGRRNELRQSICSFENGLMRLQTTFKGSVDDMTQAWVEELHRQKDDLDILLQEIKLPVYSFSLTNFPHVGGFCEVKSGASLPVGYDWKPILGGVFADFDPPKLTVLNAGITDDIAKWGCAVVSAGKHVTEQFVKREVLANYEVIWTTNNVRRFEKAVSAAEAQAWISEARNKGADDDSFTVLRDGRLVEIAVLPALVKTEAERLSQP